MPNATTLIGFIAASLVVLLIPGPGIFYVVARSMSQGYRAGFASAVGLSAGALVHVLAAIAGLSAILAASATAFTIVKIAGAGYLIYLGLRILLSKHPVANVSPTERSSSNRLFVDGVFISVLNPKIALFFLAFLPQFVNPELGSITRQILILGLIYVALALITDGSYALLAGRLRKSISPQAIMGPLPRRLSGFAYLGLGISAALVDRNN